MRLLFFVAITFISLTLSAQTDKSSDGVDEMPRFVACLDQNLNQEELSTCAQNAFLKHIYDNLKYPAKAKQNKTEGKVIIKFTISKYGRIENAHIEKDLGDHCGQAALDALLTLNLMDMPFLPGRKNKIAVPVEMVLPINFVL